MSESDFQATEICHMIYVAQPENRPVYYGIMTVYWETDAINAVGQVRSFVDMPDGTTECESVLNTNDDLSCIACSPDGNLWVGSCNGRVWTTAAVDWDASKIPGIEFTPSDPDFVWKGTEAIRDPDDIPYNIAAIWGSSDQDVFFGTFAGAILHWDGAKWSYSDKDNAKSIQRMHGTGPRNIWAVGRDGLVMHFDGSRWRNLPIPGDAGRGENLTGVWALSDDEVYICSTSGAIFHGNHNGLERLGEYEYSFYGIVEFKGDLFLAAGDDGVCVLKGNGVEQVKKTFAATGVYRLPTTLAFVQPAQEEPGIIVFDPANPKPWTVRYA
jgi:hypothetical protein